MDRNKPPPSLFDIALSDALESYFRFYSFKSEEDYRDYLSEREKSRKQEFFVFSLNNAAGLSMQKKRLAEEKKMMDTLRSELETHFLRQTIMKGIHLCALEILFAQLGTSVPDEVYEKMKMLKPSD